jgi:hypothetical protein
MHSIATKAVNPAHCPLCGLSNDCQLCSADAYKGPCWCAKMKIADELIAQVPPECRNRTCICRACIMKYHRSKAGGAAPKILPGDFYFDGGLMVFNAAFHLRRGYCCENGCRHCPYGAGQAIVK